MLNFKNLFHADEPQAIFLMTAVIIDDSQNAVDALIAKLGRHCVQVKVSGSFTNPEEALQSLSYLQPDIIFLDVEMPGMDGFELLQQLRKSNNQSRIVFVTAYNHYAIKAIRTNAFDYLEKPVDVKQLKETVQRAEVMLKEEKTGLQKPVADILMQQLLETISQLKNNSQQITIPLTVTEGINMVQLSEIVHLESLSNYTRFYLADGRQLVVSKTMGEFEELLLKNNFFRIHRSHIINLNYLRHFHKNNEAWVEMKDGSKIEVSDRKRKELTERLNNMAG
jgi:two-component system, LytTR family, response regulator